MREPVKKERRLVWFKSQVFGPSSAPMSVLRRVIMRVGVRYIVKLANLSQGPGTA